MEPKPLKTYISPAPCRVSACAGTSSEQHGEVICLTPRDSHGTEGDNRKRKQVIPLNVIDIDGDDDPDCVVITGFKAGMKSKGIINGSSNDWQNQIKDELAGSSSGKNLVLSDSTPIILGDLESLHDQANEYDRHHDDYMESDEDGFIYTIEEEDDDYFVSNWSPDKSEDTIDDLYLSAQLDAVDLPPGQEAPFPWLEDMLAEPSNATKSISTVHHKRNLSKHMGQKDGNEDKQDESEPGKRFSQFKQFDTVHDCSDHHYSDPNALTTKSGRESLLSKKTSKDWPKIIQHEWKLLEKALPDTIFVRVFEERLDLLRAVIVGAAGTPYHDGLFFFDVCFPPEYPKLPPLVYYHSGGLRLNPNLYSCGKVCLSLLNTWYGNKNERWTPGTSTLLQVLLSIQALVLNAKPYFNEPGWEAGAGQPNGEKAARSYNEDTFMLSCKTMMYTLRRPPKHFEVFVVEHFRSRAHAILESCVAYMDGAQVGCLVSGGVQDIDEGEAACSARFRNILRDFFPKLMKAFTDNGADCKKFSSTKLQKEPLFRVTPSVKHCSTN